MNFIFRRYKLPDPVALDFFNSEYEFRKHLMEHFLSPTEPWGTAGLLDSLFQRWRASKSRTVGPSTGEVEQMYDEVVTVLDRSIATTATRGGPYVRLRTTRVASDGSRTGPMDALYLVAAEGYFIMATDGIVRSAYFPRECRPGDPPSVLFDRAMSYLLQKASTANYRDTKGGEHVIQTNIELFPPDWTTVTNPHDLSVAPRTRTASTRSVVMNPTATRPAGGV